MEKNKKTLEAKLEALLFVHGEPITLKRLATLAKADENKIKDALETIRKDLENEKRGLALIIHDGRAELTTSPDLSSAVSQLIKDELDNKLTPASLETLSIIAYLGPCGRALIEHVRGVNSSFILRSLMIRGLIERKPDPKRANGFLYQPTFEFLNHMGLASQSQMPEFEKYRELVKSYFEEGEQAQESSQQIV
jgi:segregation and condensation protein B